MNEKTSDPATTANWDDLAAFLTVARQGGLSAAARMMGSSPATLGRRMLALERRLARELFIRRTHGYDLTVDGERLLKELQPIADRLDQITAQPAERARPL
ncbi:MAG: LysR family transcriptional regulator, partial [Pseudomonadota bacterium]